MARQRSQGLKALIKIAENAVNEALSFMGSVQQKIDAEKEKKETLIQYEMDYQSAFLRKGQAGVNGNAIEQHEAFMVQIQQALDNQSHHLRQLDAQLLKAQEMYSQLNQKLKSYQKLEARLSERALQLENRKMQSMLDEIALQMHARK